MSGKDRRPSHRKREPALYQGWETPEAVSLLNRRWLEYSIGLWGPSLPLLILFRCPSPGLPDIFDNTVYWEQEVIVSESSRLLSFSIFAPLNLIQAFLRILWYCQQVRAYFFPLKIVFQISVYFFYGLDMCPICISGALEAEPHSCEPPYGW